MHLLPGLALFAHRYHTPTGLRGLQGLASSAAAVLAGQRPDLGQVPAVQQAQPLLLWLVAAPLAFYITWQLLYFLIVQVRLRGGPEEGSLLCFGASVLTPQCVVHSPHIEVHQAVSSGRVGLVSRLVTDPLACVRA
jgi:hypothetical protein